MAQRVRISLEDDFFNDEVGSPTTMVAERVYELPEGLETLSDIEAAVEQLKQAALPELEKELLTLAQERFVAREKRGAAGSATGSAPSR
jgi:L-lactate utilization protein LutB